jgi:two-component system response regulator DegU
MTDRWLDEKSGAAPVAEVAAGAEAEADAAAAADAGPVRLAIVEDHRVVAEAMANMFSLEDGFEVVGLASSGSEAVDLVMRVRPDVVLMDVSLDGLNGIEATRRILQRQPDVKVLILTMHDDEETVASAIAARAAGFLPKNASRSELIEAIRVVAGGGAFLHPGITGPLLNRIAPVVDRSLSTERLTPKEQDVLERLAEGLSTKDIARVLGVSEETVKTHLAHIYQKLGVGDRVQAVALAIRRGLVS